MASKGDLASETNLHCVRRSFKSFLGDGEGGGRGVAERGIRSGKRVLHDLALTLLFTIPHPALFSSLSRIPFFVRLLNKHTLQNTN